RVVAELQAGWDQHDADIYDRHLAADAVWGSPFGATVHGYEELHAIHVLVRFDPVGGYLALGGLPDPIGRRIRACGASSQADLSHGSSRGMVLSIGGKGYESELEPPTTAELSDQLRNPQSCIARFRSRRTPVF